MPDATVGDTGLIIRCYTGRDLTGFVTKQILVRKPGGVVLTKEADVYGDAKDGYVQFTTGASDLDERGEYEVSVRLFLTVDESDEGMESPIGDSFDVGDRLA